MNIFILRVAISFVVGGLFISLQTLIAERVPLKWRGVVLTIPSTLALGLFFVGLTKGSSEVAHVAVFSIAATFICTYVFGAAFAVFSRWNVYATTIGAFIAWAVSAILLISFPPHSLGIAILVGFPIFLCSYFVVNRLPRVQKIVPVAFTFKHIFVRSLFAGTVIAGTVVLAKVFGDVWGGVFSAFPAVFSTTLIIYYLAHGGEVVPSVVRALFFPGALILFLYAFVACFAFPVYGIWIGTLLAYAAVLLFILVWQQKWQTLVKPAK